MSSRKTMTSWQRRKQRRVRMILRTTLFCVFVIVALLFYRSLLNYKTVDLSEYATYEYSGYNHKGSVEVTLDQEKVSELIRDVKEVYGKRLLHIYKCSDEDYNAFYNSLEITTTVPNNLSNGSQFIYTVNYDKSLAKKIRLSVKENKKTVTVTGLVTATVLKIDDIFKDLHVEFSGVSPNIQVSIENMSTHPFIQNMVFVIVDPKEFYSLGEEVQVRAYFSEAECLDKHFAVEVDSENCIKSYAVSGVSEYIQRLDDLPKEIIDEAVKKAESAFTTDSALEFGLRVFSEAHLTYVIDPATKKYTFRWSSYRPLSAYFKVPNKDIAGKSGNNYNDLDVIFSFVMTQADGKQCNGEAAIRFSNISRNSDGTYEYDFSKAKITSASHLDSRIKKNVINNYEKDYSIEKIVLK